MAININLSEADFNLIKSKMIEFLKRDASPFKNYNFQNSALSGILDMCCYVASYMATYLNMTISEMFMKTATLEKSIYTLIHNFNYIPKLNGPAKRYLLVQYERGHTDCTILTFSTGNVATYTVGETVTGGTTSATGVIETIDSTNKKLYLTGVSGTFVTPETITGSDSGIVLTATGVASNGDYYSTDDVATKKHDFYFNYLNYTVDYKAIGTFRDKYVADRYTTLNLITEDVTTENKAIFRCDPYIDTTNNVRYLQSIIPLFQAEWVSLEISNIDLTTFEQLIYLSDDGTESGEMYGDKVIEDTIKVYVKETDLNWYEYTNIKEGIFDHENKRSFQMKYSEDYGIYIKFNIDGFSRAIDDTESIRVFFVITEGDDINEIDGTMEFNNDSENLDDIGYVKIVETVGASNIFEMEDGIVATGDEDKITLKIIDSDDVAGNMVALNNGTPKQTIDDIKESAPMFFSTQGRAVTENDYNCLLKQRFSEYYDTRAWGGQKEFINLRDVIINTGTISGGFFPLISTELLISLIQQVMGNQYNPNVYESYLTVKSPTQSSLELGEHIRDKGYVYFTISKNNFQFETNADSINAVTAYLDKYKILSIYFKYIYPTYVVLQPFISIKMKSAYTKTFDLSEIKQNIMNYVNTISQTTQEFFVSTLYSYINTMDEVDYVDNITYTIRIKVKNQASGYTYARIYSPFQKEINTTVEGHSFVTEDIGSTSSIDPDFGLGKILIDGVDCGRINYSSGILRYTYDFGVSEYYIDDVVLTTNKLYSLRDCYYGIETISNITIDVD